MSQNAKRYKKNYSKSSSEKFVRGCSDKARYRSREKAADHLVSIRYKVSAGKSEGGAADRFPVRAYACNNCNGFHLTSAPERSLDHGLAA
jgi:hypothetical protein